MVPTTPIFYIHRFDLRAQGGAIPAEETEFSFNLLGLRQKMAHPDAAFD